jgi:hypothetical protein
VQATKVREPLTWVNIALLQLDSKLVLSFRFFVIITDINLLFTYVIRNRPVMNAYLNFVKYIQYRIIFRVKFVEFKTYICFIRCSIRLVPRAVFPK